MIVDRLILHHNYDGPTAVDISQNRNHGRLESVVTAGGTVAFDGGDDCVRVPSNPLLKSMRAIRASIRFRWDPNETRRYNLLEGYLSFALVIDAGGYLHGTINSRGLGWIGAQSATPVVQPGVWHEASMVHDGFSAIRVDLDGVTVAESLNIRGPVTGIADPLGLCIGHWAGDNRYTFVGEIDDVKIWIDRPDTTKELIDKCCMDGAAVDDLFEKLRSGKTGGRFDRDAYQSAGETMMDLGSRTFGRLAAGSEADRVKAWNMARQFMLAYMRGDRDGFVDVVGSATADLMAKTPTPELAADAQELIDALRQTALGPVLDAALGGAPPQQQRQIAQKLGILGWLDAFCLDWTLPKDPDRPKGDGPGRDDDHRMDMDPTGRGRSGNGDDPTTDRPPDSEPPQWGFDPDNWHNGKGADR